MIQYFIISLAYAVEEYDCALNVQTLCAPGTKIRQKQFDPFAHWNFDYDKFVDIGPHNHLTSRNEVIRTNSIFGTGAQFNRNSLLDVSFVPSFESDDWVISFAIMFEEMGRQTKQIDPIIQLFNELEQPTKILQIIVNSITKHFEIHEDSILITSIMRIQPSIWYRVFLVRHDLKLTLYINGFKEGQADYQVSSARKRLTVEGNNIPFNLDSLKLYTRLMEMWEIIAASQLFQQNSEWLMFQCEDCDYAKAVACADSYHLCSSVEYYAYGINTAKNMGWFIDPQFWTQETVPKLIDEKSGSTLCCRDVDYILKS